MAALPRARCLICGDERAVTALGRLVSHQGRDAVGRRRLATCDGSATDVTTTQLVAPPAPAAKPDIDLSGPPGADRFAFDRLRAVVRCGFCSDTVRWAGEVGASLAKSHLTLTGEWGIARDDTDRLVVAIAAVQVSGGTVWLPHVCPLIPSDAIESAVANGR